MKSTSMYSTFYCKFTIKSKNYTHFSFSPYNQKSGLTFWGAVKKSIPCSEQKNNDPEDVKINRITQEKFSYTWILHSRVKSDKITKFALSGKKTKNTVLLGCKQCKSIFSVNRMFHHTKLFLVCNFRAEWNIEQQPS